VLAVRPDILLAHPELTVVPPSVVLEFAVVGFEEVLQTRPLVETAAPPFEEMVPPLVAVV